MERVNHSSVIDGRIQQTSSYQRREGYYIEDEIYPTTQRKSQKELLKERRDKRKNELLKDCSPESINECIKMLNQEKQERLKELEKKDQDHYSSLNWEGLSRSEEEELKTLRQEKSEKDFEKMWNAASTSTETPNFPININQFKNYNSISQ